MKIGDRVRIRALEKDDLSQVAGWLNNPALNNHLATAAMMSLVAEGKWFDTMLQTSSEEVFMIDRRRDGAPDVVDMLPNHADWEPVGGAGLQAISTRHGSATFGIYIGNPALWGDGLGTEATALVLDYAFGDLRLNRIELEVFPDNPRAIRSYEKLGFVREGIRREAFFRSGGYRDAIVMSQLAREWLDRRDVDAHVFEDD